MLGHMGKGGRGRGRTTYLGLQAELRCVREARCTRLVATGGDSQAVRQESDASRTLAEWMAPGRRISRSLGFTVGEGGLKTRAGDHAVLDTGEGGGGGGGGLDSLAAPLPKGRSRGSGSG